MPFFDKLMFWKKKEEPFGTDFGMGRDAGLGGIGQDAGLGLHDSGMGSDFGLPTQTQFPQQQPFQQSFQQPAQQQYNYPSYQQYPSTPMMPEQPSRHDIVGKDIEIVSSKLDALRAILESVNQRLMSLERIAYGDQDRKKGW